jgi:hypothetical protein
VKSREICSKFRIYSMFLGPTIPVVNNSFRTFSIVLKFKIYIVFKILSTKPQQTNQLS